MSKFIFITGGVMSSLGKGIIAASVGALLEANGYSVSIKKFDPYLNVDPATMSPFQHGEVFVTDDGAETDLDLGHYERFTNFNAKKTSNVTSGKIYYSVLEKERNGEYLGKTVQVIPHITDAIQEKIIYDSDLYDVNIIEIGGTVGDIESEPFLEATRQFIFNNDKHRTLHIHIVYVPYLETSGELKTKPAQHSVKQLMSIGLIADILICRSELPIADDVKSKVSMFCNLPKKAVINVINASSIYEVPMLMKKENADTLILDYLRLNPGKNSLKAWEDIVHIITHYKYEIHIAIVGKYTDLKDAYISLSEALTHGGIGNETKVNLKWIEAAELESLNDLHEAFNDINAILIPGGFGNRGIEGKIKTIQYARENKVPLFGICLGLQCIVIEYARNVLGIKEANSTEMKPDTTEPVIDYMEEQKNINRMGGSMRLGEYHCKLKAGTKAREIYDTDVIKERHRHRLEVNTAYRDRLQDAKLIISGVNVKRDLVEMIELEDHPWFVACQFHPEFKSKPTKPHPLFVSFVKAGLDYYNKNK